MGNYFKRAWSDTFHSLGGMGWLYALFLVPFVGFALHYLVAGSDAMGAQFQIWLIYGLAAAVLVFLSLLLWNLAAVPYRLQKEKTDKLETRNLSLLSRIESLEEHKARPRLQADIEAIVWGGSSDAMPDKIVLCIWATVRNTGTAPSITDNFRFQLEKDGLIRVVPLQYVRSANLGFQEDGRELVIEEKGAIYNVTSTPIAAGGLARGHAITFVPSDGFLSKGCVVSLLFRDVHGVEGVGTIIVGEGGVDPIHVVGMQYANQP